MRVILALLQIHVYIHGLHSPGYIDMQTSIAVCFEYRWHTAPLDPRNKVHLIFEPVALGSALCTGLCTS